MAVIQELARARQLARAIASDVAVYNPEKIAKGLEEDNLFEAMEGEIEEGRRLFRERVSPELYNQNLFDRAIVDVLVKSHGHIECKAW